MQKCKDIITGEIIEIPLDQLDVREAVYGIIIDLQKRILTFVLGEKVEKIWFVGGGVEEGEVYEETLKREALEEAGLDIEVVQEVEELHGLTDAYYHPIRDYAFLNHMYFYLCRPSSNENTDLDSQTFEGKAFWRILDSITEKELQFTAIPIIALIREKIDEFYEILYPI